MSIANERQTWSETPFPNEYEKKSKAELIEEVLELRQYLAAQDWISTEDLAAVIRDSADGILVVDPEGIVLFLNPAAERILQRSKHDILGRHLGVPSHEGDPIEIDMLTPGGKTIPVEFWGRSTRWGGKPAIRISLRDLSQKRAAENALVESERKYRTLFETMSQGVMYQNTQGKITSANPAAERILEISAEEMKGDKSASRKWIYVYESGEELPAEAHPSLKALETGQTVHDVVMGLCDFEKKVERWLRVNAIPQFRAGENQPHGVYTIFEDITERRQARLDIEKKTSQLEKVLDHAIKSEQETQALFKAARAALQEHEFNTAARSLFDIACEVTGAVSGYIALLSENGSENEVLFLESGGLSCDVDPELPMPVRGLRAEAYNKGEVVWHNDFMTCGHARFLPPGHVQLRNVLFAPLSVKERVVGVMGLANKPGRFSGTDGKLAGALGDLAAIALQRTRTEALLVESEKKYRVLADHTLDVIWQMDLDLKFTYVNPAIQTLTGYTPEEWIGSELKDHADQKNFEKMASIILKEMDRGAEHGRVIFEAEMLHRDGSAVPVEIHGKIILNEEGRPAALQGTTRDIQERKKAEAELQKREEFLHEIGEITKIGGWEIDLDSDTVFWTRGTSHIHEMPEDFVPTLEEAIGFFAPEAQSLLKDAIRRAREEGIPYDLELPLITAKGRKLWTRAIGHSEFKNGKCLRLHGTFQDITEMRRMETERREAEAQFQMAQKLESIGRLAGGVAHDFNNMLSLIIGYGEELFNGLNRQDPRRDYAEEIVKAGRRSADLTRQLLAFSRRQTLQPEVLNLNDIVCDLDKLLHRLIGEDIALKLSLAEDLGEIKVDPGQIEQIIMNLAVNARDAMPNGGTLSIETDNIVLDEQYVRHHADVVPGKYGMLSVADTGCGMDKETLKQVFDPFFTTKEKGRGTGLGLASVYGIVKQSGGHIWIYSEPGLGTTVKLYFPHTSAQKESEASDQKEETMIESRGETVLVVEDEPSLRKLCKNILKSLNYNVIVAANGEDALNEVERKSLHPDLVITDVVMPGMNGKALVDRLQKILPNVKVLYMSGYPENAISHHGVLDPGKPVLQKPFDKPTLFRAVGKVLYGGEKTK